MTSTYRPATRKGLVAIFAAAATCWSVTSATAANPEQLAMGRQLFMQEFATTAPGLQGDGLGPVFNAASCVACHHVGGVGGAGDVQHNARSLGMTKAIYHGSFPRSSMTAAIASFSPGFIDPNGSIIASYPLHRRGGSPFFNQLRQQTLVRFNADWDDDSKATPDSVHAERTPQQVVSSDGRLTMTAQVFARNTTALFGAGLIDQIPDSVIWQQAKLQVRDAEISGRPGTLEDGRLGKFGWRANFATLLEFNENACAAELGLQSKRVPQPFDLTQPAYVNANPDINDDRILAMNTFVASLPRPERLHPEDSRLREQVIRGEQRFGAIGCAKCHTPSLGTVPELYSDLLLHDMSPYAIDFAAAPPYRKNILLHDRVLVSSAVRETQDNTMTSTYYGHTRTLIEKASLLTETETSGPRSTARKVSVVEPPRYPPTRIVTPVGSPTEVISINTRHSEDGLTTTRELSQAVTQKVVVSDVEPTLVNQEWRTPPLWGVRDSAPYLHDGRAATLFEAIIMHDGEARGTRNRFSALSHEDQQAILAFLETLVAPQSGVIPAPKEFTRRDLASR